MRPPIDGNAIMAHTGMDPGPQVGEAWNWLLELRLEVGPVDEATAKAALDHWWAAAKDGREPPSVREAAEAIGIEVADGYPGQDVEDVGGHA
jgi:hypothetical protein